MVVGAERQVNGEVTGEVTGKIGVPNAEGLTREGRGDKVRAFVRGATRWMSHLCRGPGRRVSRFLLSLLLQHHRR